MSPYKNNRKKVLVIGLDCASPDLVFDRFRDELPNINYLMKSGIYAKMRTIHPPITIPAWMGMCSGMDAGEMGIYGFRTRKNGSYNEFNITTSLAFKNVKKIWDILSEKGKKSILVGIPPSYPVYPVDGIMIADFICPDAKREYTYPSSLKKEIENLIGEYVFDVPFRINDRELIKKNAWDMTEKRFKVIKYLLKEKEWDFFMFVEIGVDRIHHAFWKYFDKSHHLYEEGNPFEDVIPEYYKLIDKKIGEVLSLVDDDTDIFVVSDHGVKSMEGAFCINEWFIKEGYLTLNSYPEKPTSLSNLDINWNKTKAWGWGGYYGRIFINKAGREKYGVVSDNDFEKLRNEIIEKLENEKDRYGRKWNTKVYKPEKLYKTLKGDIPDLMAYFDDLAYRSAGTVGHNSLYLSENDTGPDDAMHDWFGIFIQKGKDISEKRDIGEISILSFKDRVLESFGLK